MQGQLTEESQAGEKDLQTATWPSLCGTKFWAYAELECKCKILGEEGHQERFNPKTGLAKQELHLGAFNFL